MNGTGAKSRFATVFGLLACALMPVTVYQPGASWIILGDFAARCAA